MPSPRRETRVTVEQPLTEAEALAALDARWAAAEAAKGKALASSDGLDRKPWTARGTFDSSDPNYAPASPAALLGIQALFAEMHESRPSQKGAMSAAEQVVYVDRAVNAGRFGANILARLFKGTMGTEMARDFSDELMTAFFIEHAPRTAAERALVEHAAIVHGQLLLTRCKWSGAEALSDIEALTRVQARLTSEFNRILDALATQRDGRRLTIANANIAQHQVVQQFNGANEKGTTHVEP